MSPWATFAQAYHKRSASPDHLSKKVQKACEGEDIRSEVNVYESSCSPQTTNRRRKRTPTKRTQVTDSETLVSLESSSERDSETLVSPKSLRRRNPPSRSCGDSLPHLRSISFSSSSCSFEASSVEISLPYNIPPSLLVTSGVEVPLIQNIPYAHGGYAAAAPIMLKDDHWMDILRQLMPESHADVVLKKEDRKFTPVKMIKWGENNPVIAAYGVIKGKAMQKIHSDRRSKERRQCPPSSGNSRSALSSVHTNANMNSAVTRWLREAKEDEAVKKTANKQQSPRLPDPHCIPLEWDVFLDPNIVNKVERAMNTADLCKGNEENIASEIEVDRQVARLINRMVLAHGSTTQLVAEAFGMAPKYNFSRVERSVYLNQPGSSNGGNGIFITKWLILFAKALQIGSSNIIPETSEYHHPNSTKNYLNEQVLDNITNFHQDEIPKPPPMCGLFLCLGMDDPNSKRVDHMNNTMLQSIRNIKEVLGTPLKVVLDLKSKRVPPRIWARLVDNLRARGLCVDGLGSFDIKELRAISKHCSTPVTQILFFHSAGDLQRACHAKEVRHGDTVYFNAGSLIWQKPSLVEAAERGCCVSQECAFTSEMYILQPYAHPRKRESSRLLYDLPKLSSLHDYQMHYDLKIGLYVQEFSICKEALSVLTKFINKYPSLYNLGLAWGGLNGMTLSGVNGDGFWNQRIIGKNWDIQIGPRDKMRLKPEDQPAVREVLLAGPCGAVVTVNDGVEEVADAIASGTRGCGRPTMYHMGSIGY